jgi:cytochrome c oxidase assembly factor CtaG
MPVLTLLAHDASSAGDALPMVLLVFAALVYGMGQRRLVLRPAVRRLVHRGNLVAGWSCLGVLALALCPPVDAAADAVLWAHMIQHLLIGLVAPLLWCGARPVLVCTSALDRTGRRSLNHAIAEPSRRWRTVHSSRHAGVAAMTFHIAVWWGWHLPSAFDLALRNSAVHALEHTCLFLAGIALFGVCLNVRWHDRGGLTILYLFGAAVGTGMVGALLTIIPNPVYAVTNQAAQRWGLTRLSDQQLGGVIMWVVGGAIYLGVATVLGVRWLSLGPARHHDGTATAPVGWRATLHELTR